MKKQIIIAVIVTFVISVIGTSYAVYKLKASEVSFDKVDTNLNSDDVQAAIDELALELNGLKGKLAAAVTNKGVSTDTTASFETIINNINNIGVRVVTLGNASSYDLDDKTLGKIDLNKLTSSNFYAVLSSVSYYGTKNGTTGTSCSFSEYSLDSFVKRRFKYDRDTHVVSFEPSETNYGACGNYSMKLTLKYTLYLVY